MDRERESEQCLEMRQLAKDIHRELGALLIRVGRIEERQLELEKSVMEDKKMLKEYLKDELDYTWKSMLNYIDSQSEKVKNRPNVQPQKQEEKKEKKEKKATEKAITGKADTSLLRCFTCDDWGHIGRDCPHAGTNLRICFQCKQLADHIAAECPQRLTKDGDQQSKYYDNEDKYDNRPYRQFYNRDYNRGRKRSHENEFYGDSD